MDESVAVSNTLKPLIKEPCAQCGQPVLPAEGPKLKQSGAYRADLPMFTDQMPEGETPAMSIAIDVRCENGHTEERRGWQPAG